MATAARTSTACDIAGIAATKFNGLVASGEYPCAPRTDAGATRIFEIDDITALFIFARLLEQGFKSKLAGRFACKARELARAYPTETHVTFAWNMNGQVTAVAPETDLSSGYVSGGPIMFTVTFDLQNVRELVVQGLNERSQVIGEE